MVFVVADEDDAGAVVDEDDAGAVVDDETDVDPALVCEAGAEADDEDNSSFSCLYRS